MQSFVNTFLKHYPMLHLPTSSVENMPIELTLVAVAIGARYRFEPLAALALYQAAKSITMIHLERVKSLDSSKIGNGNPSSFDLTHLICTTTMLIAFTMFHDDPNLFSDSMEFQVPLVRMLRLEGLSESSQQPRNQDWKYWLEGECRRRAKLIAFAYLNLQCITQNVPPAILVNEVNLVLPSSTAEWEATSSDSWRRVKSSQAGISFKDAHEVLFTEREHTLAAAACLQTSSIGRFILLHSVIQKMFLARHVQTHSKRTLSDEDQRTFE